MAIKNLFANTVSDIKQYSEILQDLGVFAIRLGHSVDNLSVKSAWQKCEKGLRRLLSADDKAKSLGYSSLETALKALSQMREMEEIRAYKLPEVLLKVPNIWLEGRVNSGKVKGFAGLTLKAALRKHKTMLPLIVECWELFGEDEDAKASFIYEYETSSSDDFEKDCYRVIYSLEETPLHEQFDERIQPTVSDLEDSLSKVSKTHHL